MTDAIVEIRDYTIDPESFEAYKVWAEELAVPWLKANLNIIDFWVDCDLEAEVAGTAPKVSSNGQPNVTWIIRWESKAVREEQFAATMGTAAWQEIWAKHPCPNGYLHMNARFMRAAG